MVAVIGAVVTSTTTTATVLLLLLLLLVWFGNNTVGAARSRFIVKGPVLTVTLKDPNHNNNKSNGIGGDEFSSSFHDLNSGSNINGHSHTDTNNPWIDLGSLRPHALMSIESRGRPLPAWMPAWRSWRTTVGYDYERLRRLPSFVESNLRFSFPIPDIGNFISSHLIIVPTRTSSTTPTPTSSMMMRSPGSGGGGGNTLDIEIQPSYLFGGGWGGSIDEGAVDGSGQTECSIQASTGSTAYLMAKLATKRDRWLQLVRGCYQINFNTNNNNYASQPPPLISPPPLSAIRVTPTIDLEGGQASCLIEATTRSERTKAVLNLEYDNPTLTVVHSLDARYVIPVRVCDHDFGYLPSSEGRFLRSCTLNRLHSNH